MKLRQVTITGADDSIHPEDLLSISEQYPFVEWAILLSKSQCGGNRFPSKEWMEKLVPYASQLNLAGHLCGAWLRNLMSYGDTSFTAEVPLWDYFKRVQLNFHAQKFEMHDDALAALRNETWKHHKTFIIQMDGVNNELYEGLCYAGVLASGLYDVSHGAGILPEEWPDVVPSMNPKAYRGYAGGLGPENIEEELVKIERAVGDIEIWVDMETKVRSNNDAQFDLAKVKQCLEATKKYTGQNS